MKKDVRERIDLVEKITQRKGLLYQVNSGVFFPSLYIHKKACAATRQAMTRSCLNSKSGSVQSNPATGYGLHCHAEQSLHVNINPLMYHGLQNKASEAQTSLLWPTVFCEQLQ